MPNGWHIASADSCYGRQTGLNTMRPSGPDPKHRMTPLLAPAAGEQAPVQLGKRPPATSGYAVRLRHSRTQQIPNLHNSMMALLAMKDSQSHESHPGAPVHINFMLLLKPALWQSIGPKAEGIVLLAGWGLALYRGGLAGWHQACTLNITK